VEMSDESNKKTEVLRMHQKIYYKFFGWLHLLQLFLEAEISSIPSYNTLCEIISSLIEKLLIPDKEQNVERGKPSPKPKYSPPAQTILVIYFFSGGLNLYNA
jgi:hypothetical protein